MRGLPLWMSVFVLTVGLGSATDVRADATCIGGCVGDLKGCVQEARNDKLVCRDACRNNGNTGSCMRACRVQGASDRKACRAAGKECATSCGGRRTRLRASSSPACQGECGQELSQCLRDASAGLPACIATCPTGSARGQCVQGCQDVVHGGMAVCHEQHQSCLAACVGATTSSTVVPTTSSTVATSSTTVTSTSTTTSSTVSELCGNGVIDPGEQCDTNDFGGATCPGSSTGAFLICTPECTIDFSQCPGAPTTTSTIATTTSTLATTTSTVETTSTTSPTSSTSTTVVTTTTSTSILLCGNGMIDGGEECDTNDFGGATCPGSSTGAFLVCTPQCEIDFSGCPGPTTTSTIAATTSSSTTSSTSSTVETTSSTIATTTSSTVATTSSSSTSTSLATTTSTSSSTTTSAPPLGTVLSFVTGAPVGTCGAVKSGGAAGDVRKALGCGGLNVGGGNSTVAEGPTPAGAETQMNVSGSPPNLTVTGRTEAEVGDNLHCSDTGCVFGPWLPIANAGTSTCVQNTFSAPASGTLNVTTGEFTGSFPLTSTVYLTGNSTSPCPRCLGGTPGVTDSGNCDPTWTSGVGASPNPNAPCTPTDAAGDNYDCLPPDASVLPSFPVDLTPITTGVASDSDPGGIFCPMQGGAGAFGCAGSGAANAICPGGNTPPVPDYIEEVGSPAGAVDDSPSPATLASVFCIPSVGGSLGFLINSAANLPGPGATSLPGTLALLP